MNDAQSTSPARPEPLARELPAAEPSLPLVEGSHIVLDAASIASSLVRRRGRDATALTLRVAALGVLTDPDFVADDVQITSGRNRVDDGVLGIDDGEVILMLAGEDPAVDRLIASAPVEEVRAGRPRLVAPNAASGVFIVPGMSCQHWGAAVTEAMTDVVEVESVDVDLAAKRVVVSGTDVAEDAIRAAA